MPRDTEHLAKTKEAHTPEYLFEGKKLRVSTRGARCGKLMVTYDYWSQTKPGFGRINPQSSYAERGFTHLHLATRQNDWFLNRETDAALAAIAAFARGFDHAATIGFSMGGYGVMLVSQAVDFDQALIVSPHVTFSEHQYPHETRFPAHMGNLGRALRLNERVASGLPSRAACAVIYDSSIAGDDYHARIAGGRFRSAELVDLRGGGHPATTALTRAGHFPLVLDAITATGLDLDPIRRAHAGLGL